MVGLKLFKKDSATHHPLPKNPKTMNTTPPPTFRRTGTGATAYGTTPRRGLRNKRSPSQQELLKTSSLRTFESQGSSYLEELLKPEQAKMKTREPDFLATSAHHPRRGSLPSAPRTPTTPRSPASSSTALPSPPSPRRASSPPPNVGRGLSPNTGRSGRGLCGRGLSSRGLSPQNSSRRGLSPHNSPNPHFGGGSSTRRGLRNKRQSESLIRRVSLTSSIMCLDINEGSAHSSSAQSSMEDSLRSLGGSGRSSQFGSIGGRPGLDRDMSQMSGLGDSVCEFGDESFLLPTEEIPQEPDESQVSSSHRTFEDISMQAHSFHADDENYEMEISPGVYMPFRGSQETWRAVEEGNTLETTCLECGLQLVSVKDCQCVVCSDCKMVNPIFDHPPTVQNAHGVGMGFQKDWIQSRRRFVEC